MTKKELQDKAVQDLETKKRLILEWPTSLGKGYVGARIISKFVHQLTNPRILLVVAETLHKNNWKEEFQSQGELYSYNSITTECYASLKNYKDTSWDLIVLDEMHHVQSDLRMEVFSTIKSERILGLSATMPKDLVMLLNVCFGHFTISKVTLDEAIKNEWLPEPKIYLISLELDTRNSTEVYVKEWGTTSKRRVISCRYEDRWTFIRNRRTYPHCSLHITCTPWQKYNLIQEEIEYWQKMYFSTRKEYIKTKWLYQCTVRKVFLGQLKTKIVQQLLSKLNKRYICFCTNIEQAEILGGENCIHSKKEDTREIVQAFNEGRINSLFAVGMAQEGMNLTNIEAGIIVQLDGKERPFLQKTGRVMRAEDPIQYIFYYKNTRDEEYMKRVLEGIDSNYIKTLNLNDL